jgi:hypothetical protein
MAGKGGTVVVVGVPSGAVPVPLQLVQDQQLRIQGSATYLAQDVAESIELLRSGVVRPDDLITSVVPLDSVAEAFQLAASRQRRIHATPPTQSGPADSWTACGRPPQAEDHESLSFLRSAGSAPCSRSTSPTSSASHSTGMSAMPIRRRPVSMSLIVSLDQPVRSARSA